MTDSPWDDAYDIDVSEAARSALDRAIAVFDGLGHGVEAMAPEPEPGYPAAFRTIWQAGAALYLYSPRRACVRAHEYRAF